MARSPHAITPTSIKPEFLFDHSDMAFTYQDGLEFVNAFSKNMRWPREEIFIEGLVHYAMHITRGHAGLFALVFRTLEKQIKKAIFSFDSSALRDYMMSTSFRTDLATARACIPVLTVKSGSEEEKVLDLVCFSGGLTIKRIEAELSGMKNCGEVIAILLQKFLLVEHKQVEGDSLFDFPSPIIVDAYLRHKYGNCSPPSQEKYDFHAFVKDVIRCMDGTTLKNCLSKSDDDRLLEAAYQKEFYRAATQILGKDGVVSCEVGALFSVDGRIDFWINDGRNWGIELLRDGKRRNEHMDRMKDDGKYAILIKKAEDKLVIDFRGHNSPKPSKPPPKDCAMAVFDVEYSSVCFTMAGVSTSETINLLKQ